MVLIRYAVSIFLNGFNDMWLPTANCVNINTVENWIEIQNLWRFFFCTAGIGYRGTSGQIAFSVPWIVRRHKFSDQQHHLILYNFGIQPCALSHHLILALRIRYQFLKSWPVTILVLKMWSRFSNIDIFVLGFMYSVDF